MNARIARFGAELGHRVGPSPAEAAIVALAVFLGASFAMPGVVAATVLAVGFVVLSALRVDGILYAMVLLLPVLIVIPGLPMVVRDISALLRYAMLFGLWLGCAARGEQFRDCVFGPRLNRIIAAYSAVLLISLLGNQVSDWSQRDLFRWFSYLALYLTAIVWIRTREQLRQTLLMLAISTAIACWFGLYQIISDSYTGLYFWLYPLHEEEIQAWVGRATSFLGHFNSLAGYLNLVLPFTMATAVLAKGRTRVLGVVGLCGGTLILVFTQSRGGLGAFVVSVLLGAFFLFENRKSRLIALIALLLVVAIAAPVLIGYSTRFSEVDELTTLGRLGIYLSGWNLFLSSPILGHGVGNFRYLYDPLLALAPVGLLDAHNIYLKTLAETGLVGTGLFLCLMYQIVRIARSQFRHATNRLDSILGFGVMAAMVTVLVHGFVDTLFEASPQFGALFWLLVGLLIANERLRGGNAANGGNRVAAPIACSQ